MADCRRFKYLGLFHFTGISILFFLSAAPMLHLLTRTYISVSPKKHASSAFNIHLPTNMPFQFPILQTSIIKFFTSSSSISARDLSPNTKSPTSICAYYQGGLGNQMFIFASTYGVAALNNMSLIIHNNSKIPTVFKIRSDYIIDGSLCQRFNVTGEKKESSFSPYILAISPRQNHRIGNFLQSWKYFENSFDSLRKEFIFNNNIIEKRNKLLTDALKTHNYGSKKNVTLIGVHIRRGDMVNSSYGYNVATSTYLHKAVDFFLSKHFQNPIFIVCSNGMKWSKQHMPPNVAAVYISAMSPEVDLSVLAACDHVISTVGSFSWWAGYLAGGLVTYFKWPAKDTSTFRLS